MILAIDIGNTTLSLGGFEDGRATFVAHLSTDVRRTSDEYAAAMQSALALHGVDRATVTGAMLSSVVPPLTAVVREAVSFLFGVQALVVGPGIKTGINIRCDVPSSVGADLICAAVAAHATYGSPAIVIDLGTATKLLLLRENGTLSGAAIAPGVQMGLDALAEGTAQLPKVSPEAPASPAPKNTADCMRAGVILGHAAMLDGMIERLRAEAGEELPVYATGGLAPLILPHCRQAITLDGQLVLRGLYLLYLKNQ